MRLSDRLLKALLSSWPIGHLATTKPDGLPHIVPVVFCTVDGLIYSPIDGKRKTTSKLTRLANIAHHPYAALLLDQYCADWQALWWVRIDARAEQFIPTQAMDARLREKLISKYPQYQASEPSSIPSSRDAPIWIQLNPTAITAWSQSGSEDVIEASLEAVRNPV